MDNNELMQQFNEYLEQDEEYIMNIIYDELAEFCMEKDISDKEVDKEQLEQVARIIIDNGFSIDNF